MKKLFTATALLLLLWTYARADLIISEVYFDSTDERVEIYNTGPQAYYGAITLSGAKASTVTIPNIHIDPHQAVIVGDVMAMVTDPSLIAKSGLSLNFPDTQPIYTRLLSGATELSSFSVDTGTMATAKLTNASIHRNIGDNNLYISQDPYVTNSTIGHPSNPGIVYNGFAGSTPPDIIISEVFFEGADEWFELTNKGSIDFSGELSIQGLSNNPLTIIVSIIAGSSLVIADTDTPFVDTGMVVISTQSLVIPDDGNIQAVLSFQGKTIDTFDVAEDLVSPYIDGHNSFEKVWYNGQLQITVTTGDRVANVMTGFVANPGTIFTVQDQVIDLGDTGSGGSGTGDADSGFCSSLGTDIQVSEIFFGSGSYPAYVELYLPTNIDQSITLSGSLIDHPVTISVNEEAGDYFLISNDTTGFIDNNSLHDNQELSIRGELGYLEVYGQNGQVLDKVDIRTFGDKKGVIFGSLGDCQRIFDATATMSPGFDHRLLEYKPTQSITYGGGGGGGGTCTTSDTGGDAHVVPPLISGIDITDIVYDPFGDDTNRETITLHSLLSTDFNLARLRMAVSTRSGTQSMSGLLLAGQTQIFTGNFRFPNTSACVSLLTGTDIFDVYCYPTTGTVLSTGNDQMTGVAMPLFTGYFAISDIIYDPDGSDTNNETISFVTSGITIASDTKLLIGSRNFAMDDFQGDYSGEVTLTGNFRFPNTVATCVSWLQEDQIIDTYCYDPFVHTVMTPPDIKIKSIVYDPPGPDTNNEQISLQLISPDTLDLANIRLRIGTRTARIYGTLTTGSIQTITGNFRFPNYDACVSLMFEDIIIDTLCYHADGTDDTDNISADYTDRSIDITDIVYDPPGSDTNKEELHLTISGEPVDLADDFYLTINNTKKYLSTFGIIQGDEVLIGSFRFPNTKPTCVSLHRQDRVFDTYCYEPSIHVDTGVDIPLPYDMNILSITPNPEGKDQGAESISLLLSGSLPIDLSDGFYLRINKTKRKIKGVLIPGEEQRIVGDFKFPNTATCVSIEKGATIFDTFCYDKPEEGDTFTQTNGVLKHISTLDLSILQKAQLTRFGDRLCITYDDATIKCKNAPRKVSSSNELKLYKNYVNVLHDYMMGERNILFYHSPLVWYKTVFDTAKQDIKIFKNYVVIHDTKVPVYDIQQRFALQYQQTFIDSFTDSLLDKILGDQAYKQLTIFRDQRFVSLDTT